MPTCRRCGRPCSRRSQRCRRCSNVLNGQARRGRPVPALRKPHRGVRVQGPGGPWESMTQAAEAFDVTRSALYPHAVWEGDHWLLVSLPLSRAGDGKAVTPSPLEPRSNAPYSGHVARVSYGIEHEEERDEEGCGMAPPLTVGEVAQQLRVSPESVREWIAKGELEAYQLPSGAWRIEPEALEALKQRGQGGRRGREE